MKIAKALLALNLFSMTANATPQPATSFSDGSTVDCLAVHNVGNDGQGYTAQKMEVFYRVDDGQKVAHAYFKKTVTLGNYSFDGSCGPEVCNLGIRDLRTNTVSTMIAAYAKLNQNSSQIQIMNFGENLTLTLKCDLTKKRK
ncbi:MAG: hypothetical protein H7326_05630 [Bdellovibrionaceae bacterium]|nr:hypothetical protein [Pseudobdellovibrionaceae bacterium]